jgi:uncharacterized pyridoxamine 5'-phosphate oxidase family protein
MTNEEKTLVMYEALNDVGTFFFITCKDNIPHARPVSFKMLKDGKIYLGIGTFKDAYKEAFENNNVVLTGCKGPNWFRINAKVSFDSDPKLVEECYKILPHIKKLYEDNNWEMGIFHLESGHAEFKTVITTNKEFDF